MRHPELTRSLVLNWTTPDDYLRRWGNFVRWLIDAAPDERRFLEIFMWIYTPRARNDGTVDAFIEEVLAFPQAVQRGEALSDAFFVHDTTDRLPELTVPTLVLAGGRDLTMRPEVRRAVAELIPGARFEVMEEAHQPLPGSAPSGTPASTPSGGRSRRARMAAYRRNHESFSGAVLRGNGGRPFDGGVRCSGLAGLKIFQLALAYRCLSWTSHFGPPRRGPRCYHAPTCRTVVCATSTRKRCQCVCRSGLRGTGGPGRAMGVLVPLANIRLGPPSRSLPVRGGLEGSAERHSLCIGLTGLCRTCSSPTNTRTAAVTGTN